MIIIIIIIFFKSFLDSNHLWSLRGRVAARKGDRPDGTEDDDHDSMDEDSPDPIVPPAPHPSPSKTLSSRLGRAVGCFHSTQRESAKGIADLAGPGKSI